MDTALSQKFPFILDRNLAKAKCTGNKVCSSCDIVVHIYIWTTISQVYIYIYIYITNPLNLNELNIEY